MASALSRNRARPQVRPARPAWAEIDLTAVRDNVRALRGILREPSNLMAVVKADAYGHGSVAVARAALEAGATYLGVATTDEGVELRRAGIRSPILLLGYTPPEDAETAVAHDLAVTVFQIDVARALARAAAGAGKPATVHLKVDTGMARIGVAPAEAVAMAREVATLDGIVLEGCFTHFATADEVDLSPARAQLETFLAVLRNLEDGKVHIHLRHAANSAALLALPKAHLDLVRVGIALYGIPPAPHLAGRVALRRVMHLCARVAHVKRIPPGTPVGYGHTYRARRATTIATIPLGYADGYPRLASGKGEVMLRGQRLRIAGRVSMDQCMVDAGDLPVKVGDEVELWGQALPVEEVAATAQTIPYEVLTGVSRRVRRVFVQEGQVVGVRTLLGDQP
jgi:alanine racemase